MSFLVNNKVAVVTGGSSGIGLETVRLLVAQGAQVAWCGRDRKRLADSEQQIRQEFVGCQVYTQPCNVLDADDVTEFAEAVVSEFGQVDMLINNAGQGRVSNFMQTEDHEWIMETELKLFSVMRPVKAFLPWLEKSSIGSITNVNSLLALQPEPHMIATSAARAALLNFTHSLAHEYAAAGVRVNSILLGMVESGQWQRRYAERSNRQASWEEWTADIAKQRGIPMGRLGKPTEPANALVFLASPLASYTTGSTIDVSGGFSRQI